MGTQKCLRIPEFFFWFTSCMTFWRSLGYFWIYLNDSCRFRPTTFLFETTTQFVVSFFLVFFLFHTSCWLLWSFLFLLTFTTSFRKWSVSPLKFFLLLGVCFRSCPTAAFLCRVGRGAAWWWRRLSSSSSCLLLHPTLSQNSKNKLVVVFFWIFLLFRNVPPPMKVHRGPMLVSLSTAILSVSWKSLTSRF